MTEPVSAGALLTTPLHALHRELGAKMVPFAGYDMPVSYPAGILAEHRACRESAVLFDVSHMGQLRLEGDDAAAALETLVPVDIAGLASGKQRYALFMNETGGILDDRMVTRRNDHLYLAVLAESLSGSKRLAFETFNRVISKFDLSAENKELKESKFDLSAENWTEKADGNLP